MIEPSDLDDLSGVVEVRGPELISGWAFRPGAPPVTLEFHLDGEMLGDCLAAAPRPDVEEAGLAELNVGFSWSIPERDVPIDPAVIEVREASTGETLPDRKGLKPRRRSAMTGHVEVLGPDAISGWAWSPAGPVRLAFMLGRRKLGECEVDQPRPDLAQLGFGDGRVGFHWPIPPGAELADLSEIRVVEVGPGRELPWTPGLMLQGRVEARGPEQISGWAWSPKGPVRLAFMHEQTRLGECLADRPRPKLARLGLRKGRVGFAWKIPVLDPPLDPAAIRVVEEDTGAELPDKPGLKPRRRSLMKGFVEIRGPEAIAGWAWAPDGPVPLAFEHKGRVLGEQLADGVRPELAKAGFGDGRAAFSWRIPVGDEPIDSAAIRVREQESGADLPDIPGLKAVQPPRLWGFVEARGPESIAGWAWAHGGPLRLKFVWRGKQVGRATADQPRAGLSELGFGDGRAGFEWRLPFTDPPVDPTEVEVLVEPGGERLPNAGGLRPVASPARGAVESRGPEMITGWAWAAKGPVDIEFMRGPERLGTCRADLPRPELGKLGAGDGRVGFAWRLPFLDPPVDPAEIEVRAGPGGPPLADAAGVEPIVPAVVRGLVEVRGPHFIAGWAKGPAGAVRLELMLDGERLGECEAALHRKGLEEAGLGDGRLGFEWPIPILDQPIDTAAVVVRDMLSGAVIPDSDGVQPVPPPLPPVRGAVDARGPEFIAGWARGPEGPVTLALRRRGKELARVRADLLRESLAGQPGFGDGRVGFAWRLPFTDPPFDPSEVEVSVVDDGPALADAAGVAPVTPAQVRGVVEERGPDFVSGWARGPKGPVLIEFVLEGERLGECRADGFRQDLADTGVGDGRAAFRWRLPFSDPPVDVTRLVVRDAASGDVIGDGPAVRPRQPRTVRGWVEVRGPEFISGWARGPAGPVTLRMMLGDKVLAEVAADRFREGLLKEGVGDGRAAFEWRLPFTYPQIDPAKVRVVEASGGIEIGDSPGVKPVQPEALRGVVEERSYRLVTGWAWDGRPGARLKIEILQDGRVIGTCVADRLRRDLAKSGMDDGRHGFSWVPPRTLKGFDAARVEVRSGGRILPQELRPPRDTGLQLSGARVESGWLLARLSRTGSDAIPKAVDVVSNGAFLLRADISELKWAPRGDAELQIELPRQLYDGKPHRLTLHEAREGHPLGGQDEPLVLCSAFNSMVELLTGREIRGWVIDPDDPDGEGEVELREGERLIRSAPFGRERPEVAKAMGAAHAWEFSMRRLPLDLFDGREHELSLTSAGRPLFPHKRPDLKVCWSQADAAEGSERFEGAVQEITPLSLKGFVLDYLTDGPVPLEVVVDGQVIARLMADRYVSSLKDHAGHGFHGFEYAMPSALMNGRRRMVEVRPAGSTYALPPGRKPLTFPLSAVGDPPPALDPPALHGGEAPAQAEPALLSLIVLNLDGAHVLGPFLRSIEATRFRDELEVIVIDHGSRDESRRILEDYRSRLRLVTVYRGENHSFSASCNLGAALAKGRHVVFVNNDIEFTGDALAGMRDVLDAHPAVGLVGARLLEPRYRGDGRWERATHHTGVRFRALVSQDKVQPWLYHPVEVEDGGERGTVIEPAATAALIMMRKVDLRAVGGFDEAYHYGYEDVDLALRVRGQLGKLAVCRLDVTAVHNRSATREAKLVSLAGEETVKRRPAHANLDIFTRRFSRHLPRLILGQLLQAGEAWRSAPLRIGFVVPETEAGKEAQAARAVGAELRDRFGWEPMLLAEDARDLAQTDVLVSLRPGFELRRIADPAPGLATVAWRLAGAQAWEGRTGLYQLVLDLPADPGKAAGELRSALAGLFTGPRRRIAVKAQAENEPRAHALAEALQAQGHIVRLDGPRHWTDGLAASDELVVAMAGVKAYRPFIGTVNALCVPPGVDPPAADVLSGYDQVFEAGDPEADADALTAMHEDLRRCFLGRLAR